MRRSWLPIAVALLAGLFVYWSFLGDQWGAWLTLGTASAQSTNCGLAQAAFCDTFDQPYMGGGRTGQLDPSRWTVARVGNSNPSKNIVNMFVPSNAMRCLVPVTGVIPDLDYFVCGMDQNPPESNHFMEAFDDQGGYMFNDARVRQPFDFTGRTGTVTFDVDAKTSGTHGWWVELWITDQPLMAPHYNVIKTPARNAIDLQFSATCTGTTVPNSDAGAGQGNLGEVAIVRNYQVTDFGPFGGGPNGEKETMQTCYQTMPDMRNHFEVRLTQQHLEVWATDPAMTNLRLVATIDNMNLPFSRGYVHLQHAAYNAEKEGVTSYQTYHWDNVGFDGPVQPAPALYSVADALTPGPNGGVNLGYLVGTGGLERGPLTVQNVNMTGATGVSLSFTTYIPVGNSLNYRVNGGTWHTYTDPVQPTLSLWKAAIVPLDLSEIHAGSNTIDFAAQQANQPFVTNIDLILDGAAGTGPGVGVQPPASIATATPTATPRPTATPTSPPPSGPSGSGGSGSHSSGGSSGGGSSSSSSGSGATTVNLGGGGGGGGGGGSGSSAPSVSAPAPVAPVAPAAPAPVVVAPPAPAPTVVPDAPMWPVSMTVDSSQGATLVSPDGAFRLIVPAGEAQSLLLQLTPFDPSSNIHNLVINNMVYSLLITDSSGAPVLGFSPPLSLEVPAPLDLTPARAVILDPASAQFVALSLSANPDGTFSGAVSSLAVPAAPPATQQLQAPPPPATDDSVAATEESTTGAPEETTPTVSDSTVSDSTVTDATVSESDGTASEEVIESDGSDQQPAEIAPTGVSQ